MTSLLLVAEAFPLTRLGCLKPVCLSLPVKVTYPNPLDDSNLLLQAYQVRHQPRSGEMTIEMRTQTPGVCAQPVEQSFHPYHLEAASL